MKDFEISDSTKFGLFSIFVIIVLFIELKFSIDSISDFKYTSDSFDAIRYGIEGTIKFIDILVGSLISAGAGLIIPKIGIWSLYKSIENDKLKLVATCIILIYVLFPLVNTIASFYAACTCILQSGKSLFEMIFYLI